MAKVIKKTLEVSKPTSNQLVVGAVKVVATFLGGFLAFLALSSYSVSETALKGATLAGIMAIVQLVQASLTMIHAN